MPAIVLLGRRWHLASDDLPLFALPAAVFHVSWCVCLWVGLRLIPEPWWCREGADYFAFLRAVYLCFVVASVIEILLIWLGLRGAVFEMSKRAYIEYLIYAHVIATFGEFLLTGYGTYLMYLKGERMRCYNPELDLHWRPGPWVKSLLWTNWGVIIFNRKPPLSRIAELFSRFVSHIDFTPSDVTASLIVVAASQRQRRKQALRGALEEYRLVVPPAEQLLANATDGNTDADCSHDKNNNSDTYQTQCMDPSYDILLASEINDRAEIATNQHFVREVQGKDTSSASPFLQVQEVSSLGVSSKEEERSRAEKDDIAGSNAGLDQSLKRNSTLNKEEPTVVLGSSTSCDLHSPTSEETMRTADGTDGASGIGGRLVDYVRNIVSKGDRHGEGGKSAAPSLLLTLSHQITATMPVSHITPTGMIETLGYDFDVDEAVAAFAGERMEVESSVLQEAEHYVKFATAIYGSSSLVRTFLYDTTCFGGCCGRRKALKEEAALRHGITSYSEWINFRTITKIAEIWNDDDLVYLSNENSTEGQLPYMVVVDRSKRTIVVAIRGTLSLEDCVTDALYDPKESFADLPESVQVELRTANEAAYIHGGILASAMKILEDLKTHNVLESLIEGEEIKSTLGSNNNESDLSISEGSCNVIDQNSGQVHASATALSRQRHSDALHREMEAVSLSIDDGETVTTPLLGPGVSNETSKKKKRYKRVGEAAYADEELRHPNFARRHRNCKGWPIVVTGHSLGAGAAAIVALFLREKYHSVRCWAFSPPGGLLSIGLSRILSSFCNSVVLGKDLVCRMSMMNLERLRDDMVTSLARCKVNKTRILVGALRKENRLRRADHILYAYEDIPREARKVLAQYHTAIQDVSTMDLYPPGRIVYLQPRKQLKSSRQWCAERVLERYFSPVWVDAKELIQEGILVSSHMIEDHSLLLMMKVLSICAEKARKAVDVVATEEDAEWPLDIV